MSAAVTTYSIVYVGENASVVLTRLNLRKARRLRDAARVLRDCGMEENARAAYAMARAIIRAERTCNYTIPKHRRLPSLGWKGKVS